MVTRQRLSLVDQISDHLDDILAEWFQQQLRATARRADLINDDQLREQSRRVLGALHTALQNDDGRLDINSHPWDDLRSLLEEISRSRGRQGFSPAETATFVLSLKRPLFDRLRQGASSAEQLGEDVWQASALLDGLALLTSEAYQRGREEVIARQREEMLELSTPVVRLWAGIVALPLIGTLDSARTQVIMESLLAKIVETGASLAIIDITGVPTVDTLVAQHLLKTIAAARLMGAECIISGIRPQIAQTIVHLGVDLEDVITKATLADAFALALTRSNLTIRPLS